MAVISGVNGAVYWNEELTNTVVADTIIFSSGDKTITSSTGGGVGSTGLIDFETEGYKSSMIINVSGADTVANNRKFTISAVSSGTITVEEAVTSSTGEGDTDAGEITFLEAEPGYEEAGFYNWTINYKMGLLDTTAFDTSSGGRSYIASITDWTASSDKFFVTVGDAINNWLGEVIKVRFFLNYVDSPSTGNPCQYYQGNTIVTGIDRTTPVDALITQSISFQGVGALTLTTRTTAWNS